MNGKALFRERPAATARALQGRSLDLALHVILPTTDLLNIERLRGDREPGQPA
jgi:hypothetical protein